jgi:hypothetical protein
MASKEATIYILDLGQSMGEKRHGRDLSDLDWALEYVWDKITNTVSRHSFGDVVRLLWWKWQGTEGVEATLGLRCVKQTNNKIGRNRT